MFTARYGLIPYIEQITFRLLKVNIQLPLVFNLTSMVQMYSKYTLVTRYNFDAWRFGSYVMLSVTFFVMTQEVRCDVPV